MERPFAHLPAGIPVCRRETPLAEVEPKDVHGTPRRPKRKSAKRSQRFRDCWDQETLYCRLTSKLSFGRVKKCGGAGFQGSLVCVQRTLDRALESASAPILDPSKDCH
ncbi:MAG: hypothetical protein JWO05_1012 [Gemmatimonadetes bacterium]|nr:hypothetical protein [Gemmatimonadota bacterium]